MEALLSFVCQLTTAMMTWSDAKKDELEGAREACRHLALHVGITDDIASLCELWVVITRAQVRLGGFTGDDIFVNSMGVPDKKIDLVHLRTLNPYQKAALRNDLNMLVKMLPELQDMRPSLIWEIQTVCEDALQLIQA